MPSDKLNSLAARLVEPNHPRYDDFDDDDAIFAELEAEIENDSSSAVRESGMEAIKKQ